METPMVPIKRTYAEPRNVFVRWDPVRRVWVKTVASPNATITVGSAKTVVE